MGQPRGAASAASRPRAVLLDIEGTTTSIAFVYDVLFPFARRELGAFLAREWASPAVQTAVTELSQAPPEGAPPITDASGTSSAEAVAAHCEWQMDQDLKTTGLKALQGQIWVDGYARGELRGHVYDEVPGRIQAWVDAGSDVFIYSSGSVAAQKLLFGHSVAGDLTRLLSGYFDTRTGPKKLASSYTAICAAIERSADEVIFVTDNLDEAIAARGAGVETLLSVRPGNPALAAHDFREIRTFDEVVP